MPGKAALVEAANELLAFSRVPVLSIPRRYILVSQVLRGPGRWKCRLTVKLFTAARLGKKVGLLKSVKPNTNVEYLYISA